MTDPLDSEASVAERAFVWKLWSDCWPNLAGLLGANLLFLIWCAPSMVAAILLLDGVAVALALVTVGPALLGLFTYAANLALERRASVWRDSLWGFRSGFGAGVILTAVAIVALGANRLALTRAEAAGMPAGALALWAGQLGILIVLTLTGVHTLSLLGLYQQGIKEAFRNAVILTLAHPAPTLGLVGTDVLIVQVTRAFNWGPLVIMPALLAVLAVNTTLRLVKQHHRVERTDWDKDGNR
jgi:uncharacterized membrane protein YesL